jgi:hypothetical protein
MINMISLANRYGSLAALARAAGVDPSYLSQIKNRTRAMGDEFAEKLEAGLGLERGHMDRPQSDGSEINEEPAEYHIPEDPQLQRVLDAWPSLTNKQRSEFVRNITGVERSNREILKEMLSGGRGTGTDD